MRKRGLTLISFPLKSNVLNSPNRGNASKALTLSNSAALGPANFDETDADAAAVVDVVDTPAPPFAINCTGCLIVTPP